MLCKGTIRRRSKYIFLSIMGSYLLFLNNAQVPARARVCAHTHTRIHIYIEFFYHVGKLTGRLQNKLKLVNESSGWHYLLVHIVKLRCLDFYSCTFILLKGIVFFFLPNCKPIVSLKNKTLHLTFSDSLYPISIKDKSDFGSTKSFRELNSREKLLLE